MPLKNVHYQRLETEESDGEEDEAPPTHVDLHSSHYVKGEERGRDSISILNHSKLALVGVCVCLLEGCGCSTFTLSHFGQRPVAQRERERGRGVTLHLGCNRWGLKPGLIQLLITWAQVVKESARQLCVLRYCAQCSKHCVIFCGCLCLLQEVAGTTLKT